MLGSFLSFGGGGWGYASLLKLKPPPSPSCHTGRTPSTHVCLWLALTPPSHISLTALSCVRPSLKYLQLPTVPQLPINPSVHQSNNPQQPLSPFPRSSPSFALLVLAALRRQQGVHVGQRRRDLLRVRHARLFYFILFCWCVCVFVLSRNFTMESVAQTPMLPDHKHKHKHSPSTHSPGKPLIHQTPRTHASTHARTHLWHKRRHGGRRREVRALDRVRHSQVAALGARHVALHVQEVPLRVDLVQLVLVVLFLKEGGGLLG
jgi:hypothetical protein